jgi:hypothetical protein
MEKNTRNILKKGLLKTESDFTSKIMDELNAEEKALSSVLLKHGELKTSVDFTAQLMQELEGKVPKKPYTPVISMRGWIGIAAVFTGVIVLLFSSGTNSSSEFVPNDKIEAVAAGISDFFKERSWFIYLLLGALLLSIALVLEQRSGKSTNKHV